MSASSPYVGARPDQWAAITDALLADYPLDRQEIVEVVSDQWESIFDSRVGRHGLRIGEHIFPKPQIMGDYLHELIPYEFQVRYPDVWRRDRSGTDKDLVYVPDERWSTEIKTSSHRSQVFGNRSYAQASVSKKTKSGFYLTVNFEKWSDVRDRLPAIRLIRLGWLDHSDWIAQSASSGQQARVQAPAYGTKLLTLYAST